MNSRVVVVTGANGGLGSAVVRHLLSAGFRNIACQYRSGREQIDELLAEFDLPADKHVFHAELTDEASVASMAESITAALGPVGALVNMAGGSSNGMSWKLSADEFRRIIDMNLTSTFLACKAFIPGMRDQRFGRIVNVSSVVGTRGAAGASHYGAAKAGVNGLTRSMALELIRRGITVNALALGYFDAGIIGSIPDPIKETIIAGIPAGRLGSSGTEIGPLVEFLIGDASGYLTGQILHVDGGL